MNILYLGDVMAEPGIYVIEKQLPELIKKHKVNFTLAQLENLSAGKGILPEDFYRVKKAGVDFGTGGNWSLHHPEINSVLQDPKQPIIRPANYPDSTPGLGFKYADTKFGKVLVISILGNIVGRDSQKVVDNPLKVIDKILESESKTKKVATVVNIHGDYSSEKLVFGYYLDGRVTMVVGDHWHIPTADSRVLPKGTAHITDVGMCGTVNSSLGVKTSTIIKRWRDSEVIKNDIETEGPFQLNALLVEVDETNGLAKSVKLIQEQIN